MAARYCLVWTILAEDGTAKKEVLQTSLPTNRHLMESLLNDLAVPLDQYREACKGAKPRGMTLHVEVN